MVKVTALIRVVSVSFIVSLAACGGSDNSANSPSAPSVTLAVGLKQLQLSWAAVSGASSYRILENPDGASGFTQVGSDLSASQTSFNLDIAVHLQDWANAQYQVEACNSGGCTSSNTVDAVGRTLEAVGYFKASNTETDDGFGLAAISGDGNTMAVGADNESSAAIGIDGFQADNSATESGAVYIFVKDSAGAWSQQAYIKASNTQSDDDFAWVSLSDDGNTLAVGAESEDSSATGIDGNQLDNSASNSGAVYIFTRNASTWTQQAYIKASNTGEDDEFGIAPVLSGDGNTLAVGAQNEASAATGVDGNQADNSASGSGAIYIFARSGSTWTQQAYIKASNTEVGDNFGRFPKLSNDGNTLAVGAGGDDSVATGINGNEADNSASGSGAVYIFTRDNSNTWSQQAYIKASNTDVGDDFALSALSGDGNTLAVGACEEDSAATGINGNEADNSATDSGAVYIFTRDNTNTWSQQAYIKASNTDASDEFCIPAISDDGNTLAVGAGDDSVATGFNGDQTDNSATESGAVYLFTRTGDVWSQQAYIKAPNSEAGDFFGWPALSSDGSTLAIGSGEDSAATGIGGDQSDNSADRAGAVFLY